MRITALAAASLLAVTACASVPSAPESMVQSARTFTPTAGKARIYIWRPGSIVGSAVAFTIDVDGRIVGSVSKGTFLMTEVDPGNRTVTTRSGEGVGTAQVVAEAGHCYFFKVWPKMGVVSARTGIEQSTEEDGKNAVNSSRMAASSSN